MIELGKEPRWTAYLAENLEDALAAFRIHGTTISTIGLHQFKSPEIAIDVMSSSLLGFGRDFLTTIARYVANGAKIYDGQTVACGSWPLRATTRKDGTLFLNELSFERPSLPETSVKADVYKEGVESAISLWRAQTEVCVAAGSEFVRASFADYDWISLDVLDNKRFMQCSREPAIAADGFSGWWILPPC